jgi:tetratricopeptide (TPR) repeat protein
VEEKIEALAMKQTQEHTRLRRRAQGGAFLPSDELAGLLPTGWPTDIPLVRIWTCGLLAIEVLREVRHDPDGRLLLVYEAPDERLMQRKGSTTALNLLKLLASQPGRFATKDWLLEKLHRSRGDKEEWGGLTRFDNVVSLLRGLLCPQGMPGEEHLRKVLVEWISSTPESGTGYRLACFPLIWLDVEAMGAHVRLALERESAGQDAFPSWYAAHEIGKRGPFLAEAPYSDWAAGKRGEIEGYLWQSVQALWRLYVAQKDVNDDEEAFRLLQNYWLGHIDNEQAFLPLLSLLSKREEYQLAEQYYEMLCEVLKQTEQQPTPRIEEAMTFVRTQQYQEEHGPYRIEVRSRNSHEQSLQELAHGSMHNGHSSPLLPPLETLPGSSLPRFWNVPYQRNPYFTGREDVLTHLHDLLTRKQIVVAIAQHALCGLGGIGKTQTVLEYVYRYGSEYQAIFWIKADTRENLFADFLSLAQLLVLPERDAQDQAVVNAAIGRWLQEHIGWLLVFDNADDLEIMREVLPTGCQGHVLLTTRAQAMGRVAHRLEVEEMSLKTGALFLLRRAGLIDPDAPLEKASEKDRVLAEGIVQELGGLPLALDQAGAYIEETASNLQEYLDFYHTYRLALLQRRGGLTTDHPESVATTWRLSFTRIENSDPVAASLLRLCAFLDPDAIPEELLFAGLQQLDGSMSEIHQLRFIEAIGSLLRFSLVRRNADTHTITVHRLIQSVVRDNLLPDQQSEWIHKTVVLLSEVFPSAAQVTSWPLCEKFLPHALLCAHWMERADITSMQAASLLDMVGYYLNMRARYEIAMPLFQRALRLREQVLGELHPDTAQTLSNLAYLYHHQDLFEEAMHFLQRSLSIRQQVLGMEHPETATSLNALGLLYRDQERYEEAEPFFQRALAIRKQIFGTGHPQTAHSLSNLAWLYRNLGKYQEAEPLYEQSLAIRKQILGADHPDTATSLNGLALLYAAQKKYAKAESLFQQALVIRKQVLGTKHLHTTQSMNALALLYCEQGEYEEAERLLLEVVAIREHLFGNNHPRTLVILNNLTRCQKSIKK